ncbi:hypothetical protein G4B84_008054 [Aspergillus flavus NRRL3357]|nr:uncharacterized protein G4B84_008054 [Aspergillus flavus NRRL3357]QMW32623.1 hypothetical protein G4B84_008054 [Aspergillus flavus NRRL3357]QMW44653.1 hypothetical protein G4B11_008073 [Aspergillus flavus]
MVYWAINLVLILTNVDLGSLKFVGKRLGWVALANLLLLVFLTLRNTPLAPLSGRSYEKLRPLHKTAGYTTIGLMFLHAIVYLSAWSQSGSLHKMQEIDNAAGAVAGVAMFVLGLPTIGWFVRKSYEVIYILIFIVLWGELGLTSTVFYMVHVLMFILIMIMVGMHRPKISTHSLVIVIFTSCMWFSDRLLRLAKICWFSVGNHATVTALLGDTVHVRLTRNVSCRPGSHVFLWLPSIRLFETHPFTMVSSSPPEFVIRAYDGFTRDPYYLAHKKQGQLLRCSMDGEYGQVPNFVEFDKVVFVAGGSGASFTFAIALGLLDTLAARNTSKQIEFLWAIRSLGEYALPNDEEEQERMDLLHHIYSLILDGEIHIAPIKTPQRVLDIEQVVSLVQEASAKFGKPMDNLDTWPAAMKEAGFTDVVCKIVKAPSSPWAKDPKQMEIGRFFQAHQVHSVPAYTNVLLSKVLGWSKTEIDILNMHVLRESKNLEVHQYGKLYLIYGRKPL